MPQVVIHVSSSVDPRNKSLLVREIRNLLPEVLGVPENIGQVILYEAPVACCRKTIAAVFLTSTL